MARQLQLEGIAFAYPGMKELLFNGLSAYFPEGSWTGVVGANGAGKTTLLKLAAGELAAASGTVHTIGSACYVVQRTDEPPAGWDDFMNCWDASAMDARRLLGVDDEWADRWESLSHGERKRAQIALALWRHPDVLALDEPTNHLDFVAKDILLKALKSFHGVGLVVSHDREFLDELCAQCLFIFPPRAVMRPGGVSEGMEQDRREQVSARELHDSNAGKARRLKAAAQQRREAAEQSAARTNRLKEKKQPMHDHDGRAKRQLAKLTNKDGWGFSQSAALRSRAAKLLAPDARIRVDYEMGISFGGAEPSRRDFVVAEPAGEIELGDGRTLVFPELQVRPQDRVALVGANGAGKTTLLRRLVAQARVEPEKLLVMPQEIDETESRRILEEVKKLDEAPLGEVMTLVSRLGSRPERLLASAVPSPGEVRKLLLARGIVRGVQLMVMDEPTNHLDLPSIECLEAALVEAPCAMLLVSHDARFVDKLATIRWHFEQTEQKVRVRIEQL